MLKKLITVLISCLIALNAFAAEEKQHLTVVLDWFVNPDHAPIFIAKQKEFFKEQGLDVEIVVPSNPSDPPKWVAAGKVDLAIDYQPNWLIEVNRGLPLQQVGTLIAQPLMCLTALADGKIKSLSDLNNKKIASSANTIDKVMLDTMLQSTGAQKISIEIINVGFNLTQALLSRKVDAVMGMMRNVEPIELSARGFKTKLFYPEDYGFPNYDELIFIANNKTTQDESIKKFMSGLKKGIVYIQTHPEESWQLFSNEHKELKNEANYKVWLATISLFTTQPERVNKEHCINLANYLFSKHIIPEKHRICE